MNRWHGSLGPRGDFSCITRTEECASTERNFKSHRKRTVSTIIFGSFQPFWHAFAKARAIFKNLRHKRKEMNYLLVEEEEFSPMISSLKIEMRD